MFARTNDLAIGRMSRVIEVDISYKHDKSEENIARRFNIYDRTLHSKESILVHILYAHHYVLLTQAMIYREYKYTLELFFRLNIYIKILGFWILK